MVLFSQHSNRETVSICKISFITNFLSHVTKPSLVLPSFSALEKLEYDIRKFGKWLRRIIHNSFNTATRKCQVNLQAIVLKLCPNTIRMDSHSKKLGE
jgi:hypothetical protein